MWLTARITGPVLGTRRRPGSGRGSPSPNSARPTQDGQSRSAAGGRCRAPAGPGCSPVILELPVTQWSPLALDQREDEADDLFVGTEVRGIHQGRLVGDGSAAMPYGTSPARRGGRVRPPYVSWSAPASAARRWARADRVGGEEHLDRGVRCHHGRDVATLRRRSRRTRSAALERDHRRPDRRNRAHRADLAGDRRSPNRRAHIGVADRDRRLLRIGADVEVDGGGDERARRPGRRCPRRARGPPRSLRGTSRRCRGTAGPADGRRPARQWTCPPRTGRRRR